MSARSLEGCLRIVATSSSVGGSSDAWDGREHVAALGLFSRLPLVDSESARRSGTAGGGHAVLHTCDGFARIVPSGVSSSWSELLRRARARLAVHSRGLSPPSSPVHPSLATGRGSRTLPARVSAVSVPLTATELRRGLVRALRAASFFRISASSAQICTRVLREYCGSTALRVPISCARLQAVLCGGSLHFSYAA
jgi:hypothetical protein